MDLQLNTFGARLNDAIDFAQDQSVLSAVGGRFKSRFVKTFFKGEKKLTLNPDLAIEWKAWLKADGVLCTWPAEFEMVCLATCLATRVSLFQRAANRDMAVDKAELEFISQQNDDDAQIANIAIKLWDVMLAGKWTVNREREKAARVSSLLWSWPLRWTSIF